MNRSMTLTLAAALFAGGMGCNSYERERPPVDQLDSRDKGLQSKDVVTASDQMAASILGDPDINIRPTQMILVVDHIKDGTVNTGARFDLDIFLKRLRTQLQRQGRGRIQLVMNRDELRSIQSRELETTGDDFGQGGGRTQPGPAGLQPDYALNGEITEMNNRGTSYYYCTFTISGLKGQQARQIVWEDAYEVKVDK